jgi:hypothetical protein
MQMDGKGVHVIMLASDWTWHAFIVSSFGGLNSSELLVQKTKGYFQA